MLYVFSFSNETVIKEKLQMRNKFLSISVSFILTLSMGVVFSQKAYIDPDTGELTSPPPGEANDLQRLQQTEEEDSLEYSGEGLEVEVHPDGSESIDLQGRFQFYLYGTIDDTGKVSVSHQPNKLKDSHKAPVTPVGGAPGEYKE